MTDEMSEEQEKRCQDAFEKLDPEGSGRISVSDLKAFLHLVGLSPMSAELEALSQKAAEVNPEGSLALADACALARDLGRTPEDEASSLRDAFKVFDKNDDGTVNREDMEETLKRTGEDRLTGEDIEVLFADADVNSDGGVEYNKIIDTLLT